MGKLQKLRAIAQWFAEHKRVRVLGVGAEGIVYELRGVTTGRSYAMKQIRIDNDRAFTAAIAEAKLQRNITTTINNPNILHIEKVFHVGDKMYLVFPLCSGGELFKTLASKGNYDEYDAAVIMKDLISALRALHEHNILHLDIKPENILFESDAPDAKIKLTDFGLSKIFSNAEGSDSAPQECPSAEEQVLPTPQPEVGQHLHPHLQQQSGAGAPVANMRTNAERQTAFQSTYQTKLRERLMRVILSLGGGGGSPTSSVEDAASAAACAAAWPFYHCHCYHYP